MDCFVTILLWFSCPDRPDIALLIDQLGSKNFQSREASQRILENLRAAAIPLAKRSRTSDDPEIASRCRRLVDGYCRVPGPCPWIDAMTGCTGPSPFSKPYLDRVGNADRSAKDWPEYRAATSLWCREMLELGVPRWFVTGVLDDMRRAEDEYKRRHLGRFPLDTSPGPE